MKKGIFVLLIAIGLYVASSRIGEFSPSNLFEANADTDETFAGAFEGQKSGVLAEGKGTVVRLLPDDRDGDRHQRFILKLDSGQTLLIAHNIDISRRIASLEAGDLVSFKGQYEWNPQGGVIHWTHHDPDGSHPAGWIQHKGETYR